MDYGSIMLRDYYGAAPAFAKRAFRISFFGKVLRDIRHQDNKLGLAYGEDVS